LITRTICGDEYRSLSSSLCSLLHSLFLPHRWNNSSPLKGALDYCCLAK
jgi:hypothetical protein